MEDKTIVYYRNVFGSPEGRKVLANMIVVSGWFSKLKTTEDLASENFIKDVLEKCGLLNLDIVDRFVNAIMDIPVDLERKENGTDTNGFV